MYRQHAIQRFHAAGRAEQVAGHGFGGVNDDFARMIAQSAFNGFGFVGIAQRSRCTVCVDVINVFRIQAGIFQGAGNGQCRAFFVRRGNVVSIGAHTEADDFGVNFRTAFFRVFQFFQHQHASAFADNETVTAFVPRTGSGSRVVVAGGKCLHGGKTADAQSADRAFCATGNHNVCVAVFNQSCRVADGVCAGCTGRNHAVTRAAVAFENGDMAGNQVNQRAWDKERIDFARAAFDDGFTGRFNAR